jgi:hypothetical protein
MPCEAEFTCGIGGTCELNPAACDGGVCGGGANQISEDYGTVGGGNGNAVGGLSATVAGGQLNLAMESYSIVGGGSSNTASGYASTVGGGLVNTASGSYSTVGSGRANTASGNTSTVSGGDTNVASGAFSTVSGGLENTARGSRSTVPGGFRNVGGGDFSLAAGRRARVRDATAAGEDPVACGVGIGGTCGDEGTFVWADRTDADFTSTGPNQFLIRASGGVGINTNDPDVNLEVNGGTELSLTDGTGFLMLGDQDADNLAFDTDEIQARNNGASAALLLNPAGGNVGIGTEAPGMKLDVAGGIWSTSALGGFLAAFNPNNQSASVVLGWLNDVARIRIGGSGAGSAGGFDFQRGGDVSLMRLLNNGYVGIGTTPTAKLHVGGTAGVDGIRFPDGTLQTSAVQVLRVSHVQDLGSISAGSFATVTATVPGAVVGSVAYCSPDSLDSGLAIAMVRVSAADTVQVRVQNVTVSAINPASITWEIAVIP